MASIRIKPQHAHIVADNDERFATVKKELVSKYPHLDDAPDTPMDQQKIQRISYTPEKAGQDGSSSTRHRFTVTAGDANRKVEASTY
ncbi:unnamed protein product, partial [Clonostachys chloroleuca]